MLLSLPAGAQNFHVLDWQILPPAATLPTVTIEVPLGENYRTCDYRAGIEYPEFEELGKAEAEELNRKNVHLPSGIQPQISVQTSAHKGYLAASFVPVIFSNNNYYRLLSFKLSVDSTPVLTRTATRSTLSYAENSLLSQGRFVRVRIPDNGVYRITYDELRQMGFTNPASVCLYGYGGHLLSQSFAEHPADDLPQLPLLHDSNSVLFYGHGPVSWTPDGGSNHFVHRQNFYSAYGYYFLGESDNAQAFDEEPSQPPAANVIDTFDAYALYEKDAYAWGATGRELYEDYDYSSGNTKAYTFSLPGIAEGEGQVTVDFAARSVGQATSFTASVNGVSLGTQTLAGIASSEQYYTKATSGTLTATWGGEKAESTTVTITHNRAAGISGRLNYITLNYKRHLTLNEPYVSFRSLASVGRTTTFELSGADASTVVWDITSPTRHKKMDGALEGDKFTFTIPAGSLREFVALNKDAVFGKVEQMGEAGNQNLHALRAVDMVIIVSAKNGFPAQAERLAQAHRERNHLTVEVVTAQAVYNEFSSGTPDATAYRRLMKMLYDRSSSDDDRPKYLLLFGDCSYDNRMLTPGWSAYQPSDFLLSYQSANSLDETFSYITDDYFGFLDDNEGSDLSTAKLDIGIGRFPVRTQQEATIAVDKTIAYMENKEAGAWKNSIAFAADDGDNNLHASQAELLASYTEEHHPSFLVNRVYQDAYRRQSTATGYYYEGATNHLLDLFEEGMLMVNFTGHGSATSWTAEKLLTSDHITKMTSPRLPLWVTATCDFTRIDDMDTSAGELAFLNAKGGAIALFSTTRVVYASQNSTLNQAFIKHIFDQPEGKRLTLGDIMRLAKNDATLANDRNKLNFVLVGDPALTLAYPDYRVAIDYFNGEADGDEWPMVKAGGRVTVRGHILSPGGEPATDFNGTIHPTVLDSREEVATLDNLDEGAFTYTERSKVLFSGSQPIENGYFEFTFPVPLDINYSDQQGMMNLYALDATANNEAAGYFDRFLVGGTDDDISDDTEGPAISLYLNTPDFVPGGKTNETPMLVARLEDPDGINTVGSGIGHDLTLIIDNDAARTYSLNGYYLQDAGDYTKGTVRFSIPELSDGNHTLLLRSWDLLNNSSSATLEFEVVKGLRPGLVSVECTDSPARESTTFVIRHDRPGSLLDLTVTVYDFAGRPLWMHTERGASAGNEYYVQWNLTSSAGWRLPPGVYIYKVAVASGGGKGSSKSRKILIMAQ